METPQEEPRKRRLPNIFAPIAGFFQKGLKTIGIILGVLVVLSFLCVNLLIIYIMFAPDTWPKPFYLSYQTPGGVSTMQQPQQAQPQIPTPKVMPQSYSSTSHNEPSHGLSVPLEIKAGQGIMFDTGTKIVNLADPGGRRYVKTNIILEYAPNDITYFLEKAGEATPSSSGGGEHGGEKTATTLSYADKFKQELEPLRPLIDDTLITILSSKTFEQVYTASGKEELRKQLINALNSRMPQYKVIFIYFTEFTVQ